MKEVTFNRKEQLYDRFKRFYIPLHGYGHSPDAVLFDTGEFIYCASNAPPDKRRDIWYDGASLGVRIVGTTDFETMSRYKFKTPDGEEIKYAWLNDKGMHDLLLDEDTGVAVGIKYIADFNGELSRVNKESRKMIPLGLRQVARAYISGPGEPPVGAPITYYPPSVITKEKREHGMSLVAASKAWCALKEIEHPRHKIASTPWSNELLDNSFDQIPELLRQQLAFGGLVNGRDEVIVPYVTI